MYKFSMDITIQYPYSVKKLSSLVLELNRFPAHDDEATVKAFKKFIKMGTGRDDIHNIDGH